MTVDALTEILDALPGAACEYPFGPGARVSKVGGRMFALVAEDEEPPALTLKCDPDLALAYRQQYPSVKPGYHMNKKGWRVSCTVSEGVCRWDAV